MKKYIISLFIFVIITYIVFALLPTWLDCSIPTGGWNWLEFVGLVGSLFLSVWCLKKQTEHSVIPYLDVDAYSEFDSSAPNNVFRSFEEYENIIWNKGYILIRQKDKGMPEGFKPCANIKVTSKGLSTAFNVCTYFYELKKVDGLSSLEEIKERPIDNFYDKIECINYTYYMDDGINGSKYNDKWLISPQYILCSNSDEFNLVFDFSSIKNNYHSILKFEYEDIYQKKYCQLMYLYFNNKSCAALPISKPYTKRKRF